MKSSLVMMFLLGAIWVAGCSKSADQPSSAAPNTAPPRESKPGASPPQALADAGTYGEDIYDLAKVGDWKQATAKLLQLQESVVQLKSQKPSASGLGELDSRVAALDRAVAAKDRKTTLREANQITLQVAELHRPYQLSVPVEVTKLDYYGRELEIWAAAKDNQKLRETTVAMRAAWDAVRPAVESRKGTAEAAKFSELMSKVEAAKTSDDYRKLAGPVLDQVDNLEAVFHPGK